MAFVKAMSRMQKVCTVVVTYNGARWIEKCIRNLLQSSMPTEIIVVDNCSTDQTISLLQVFKNDILLILSEKNLGFGGGNNIGIQKAIELKADFIFLLNQDAYVAETCIHELTNALNKFTTFGILSPLQLNGSGLELDGAFKKYVSNIFNEQVLPNINNISNQVPQSVRFVNAAAWMISKRAIEATGVFHPVFFHYGEDNHYSSRMQFHGFKVGILPGAVVIHDRDNEVPSAQKLLLRQLRVVPLYTLLDIRKSFLLAYFSGYQKLKRIYRKLRPYDVEGKEQLYKEQQQWFRGKLKEALKIRKETKKKYLYQCL